MTRTKLILLRFLILLIAMALPAGATMLWAGKPATLDLATLSEWAPVKDPGPSTRALAQGVTKLAGPGRTQPPDWFTTEDQDLLSKAETALHANKLQAGLGHLMVLSSHLDERGKTLNDFLPLVAPDIATWLIATYFAPLLLGVLLVVFTFLIFMPWLVRRLIDALKVMAGLMISAGVVTAAVAVCLSISSERALIFTLIEYLVTVVSLTFLGNLALLWRMRRKPKAVPVPTLSPREPTRREPTRIEHKPIPAATALPHAPHDRTIVGDPGLS